MPRISFALLCCLALLAASVGPATAACNLIPGTIKSFNSTLGSANRPYAAPGEALELQLRDCDPSPPLSANPADHLVTVAFVPPSGTPYVAVLTADPDCTAVDAKIGTDCGGVNAECFAAAQSAMQIIDRDSVRNLSFLFPDSDDELLGADDNLTISGTTRIAVSVAVDPIPCGLATTPCASQGGVSICIDELFANDGACGTAVANATFPSFTALPPPNDFAAVCFDSSPPCNASATEVRAALDADGNFLIPCGWQGTLIEDEGVPVPRLVTAQIDSPLPFQVPDQVFLGSYTPEGGKLPPIFEPVIDPSLMQENTVSLIGSADAPYTILRVGRRHGRCSGGQNDNQACSIDTDCPGGSCPTTCVGNPNLECQVDADCGGDGPCGALFDFSGFAIGGSLVVLPRTLPGFCQGDLPMTCADDGECGGAAPCVSYAMKSELAVPLDGLEASDEIRAFAVRESIDSLDRTGDDDSFDTAVVLRSRETGQTQPLGAPDGFAIGGAPLAACGLTGTPEARAGARISDPPFSFPAVAAEGEILAFLESELDQKNCDLNGDLDHADSILRAFDLGGGELTAAVDPPRAVDPAPRLNGRSLVVSDGYVFARTSERAMARHATTRVSRALDGSAPDGLQAGGSISDDGALVAFSSTSTDILAPGVDVDVCNSCTLLGDPPGCCEDVFVYDADSGTTELISVAEGGVNESQPALEPAIAGNGRYVAFTAGPASLFEIFVRDRVAGTTERISEDPFGGDPAEGSSQPVITPDGRYVAFASFAFNLTDPIEFNFHNDIFLRDRCVSDGTPVPSCSVSTIRISNGDGGGETDGSSTFPSISDDGRYIAFASAATNLLPLGVDTNGQQDIFVYDTLLQVTERLNVQTGQQANGFSSQPSISGDGRYVIFQSAATNLAKRVDTNGQSDAFLVDRLSGEVDRINLASGRIEATGGTTEPLAISNDGRLVASTTRATNLVGPVDANGDADVLLTDLVTGSHERVSVASDGTEIPDDSFTAALTAAGDVVLFRSAAVLDGSDGNALADLFVRGIDPADPSGIDALLFADGELDDTVLEVLRLGAEQMTTLCPAGDVAVAAGNAAFLRPESAVGTADCPGGPLNGDGDLDDEVVHLWRDKGAAANLGRAAAQVALSPTYVGALVSESADGEFYNADGDMDDLVAQVHRVKDAPGSWDNTGHAADTIEMSGDFAVYLTPEADEGAPLNGDGLQDDRVLQWYDAKAAAGGNSGLAVEEFVIGEPFESPCGDLHLVAFRVSESGQGQNLNATSNGAATGDADQLDGVLHVLDLLTGEIQNSGQSVTPCTIAECDPRAPYRVLGGKVKFITNEPSQGTQDLNGDGEFEGLVLQVYDFCSDRSTALDTVDPGGGDPLDDPDNGNGDDGEVAFPTLGGRCLPLQLGSPIACDPGDDMCAQGSFCQNDLCDLDTGFCSLQLQRNCADDTDCQLCALSQPGACNEDEDCPTGTECSVQVVVVGTTLADGDDDGVPDEADNCPMTPNTDQADADSDGVGNACDSEFVALLSGKTLVFKDKDGDPSKRKLVVVSKDGEVAAPSGAQARPTAVGGSLTLYNPGTTESDTYSLPAAGWKGLGKPPGAKGYKYLDKTLANGPCKKVILKPGKLLKAVCKGDQIGFSLDEPGQGSLAIEATIGGAKQCAVYGGVVKKDTQASDGKVGVFKAKDAPAALSCP